MSNHVKYEKRAVRDSGNRLDQLVKDFPIGRQLLGLYEMRERIKQRIPKLIDSEYKTPKNGDYVLSIIDGAANLKKNDISNEFYFVSINLHIYETYGIGWLDVLNRSNITNNKYVWIIRNPIDSACSMASSLQISGTKALQMWFDINTVMWYFYTSLPSQKRFVIKYEDILLSTKTITKLFEFFNLPYNSQYLRYGDFDQPTLSCPVFNSGRINLEQISPRSKFEVLTKEECRIYQNKPLLQFMNYDVSILE